MTNTPDASLSHGELADDSVIRHSAAAAAMNPLRESDSRFDQELVAAMESAVPPTSAGSVVDSADSLSPGVELIGTVVSVTDNEVFLEFGPKAQGVMPRSQFGKKEPVTVGRQVEVVFEQFDAGSGLLQVNRKGAAQRATWTSMTVGSIVSGRVTGVVKGGLELDLKGIRAFMPASQADVVPMKDTSVLLNQNVDCEVVELDRRSKNVIVSRRRILERELAKRREEIKASLAAGQVHRGVVRRIADFGAFVDIGGVDGLLHIRDLSWGTVDKVTDVVKVGDEIDVSILKIDEKRERISLGLKQTRPDPWANAGEKYPVNSSLKARVVRLANFGAFAELEPGVEGLIPVSEMSWNRVRGPGDVVKVGDMVDCVILRAELDKRRIALSMKQAQPDPWAGVLEAFAPQSTVQGKITRLADFGAFVEIAPGVEGLIHISELSDKRVRTCADAVKEGQTVDARVLGVDKENRRISLSIRALTAPAPSESPAPADSTGRKPAPAKPARKKPLRGGLASHFKW